MFAVITIAFANGQEPEWYLMPFKTARQQRLSYRRYFQTQRRHASRRFFSDPRMSLLLLQRICFPTPLGRI